MEFLAQLMPFIVAFADTQSFVGEVVGWVGGIGGGIIAIALIVSLVKDGFTYATGKSGAGGGGPIKIIGKVLFLIVVLGLIYLSMNYDTLGQKAQAVGEGALEVVEGAAEDVTNLGGGD